MPMNIAANNSKIQTDFSAEAGSLLDCGLIVYKFLRGLQNEHFQDFIQNGTGEQRRDL
jgi:hypothetical protein